MAVRKQQGIALTRLFQMVTLMYGGGHLTQQDFAVACGCSDRQVRRYLNMLHEAGVPFTYDRKRGYVLEPNWSPLRLSLTLPEVMALLLARNAIVDREEMPFAHSAQTAFDKIAALLSPQMRRQLETERAVAYRSSGKRNYASAPWGQLLAALHRRDRLEMNYYTISRDETGTRRIDPYYIVWIQNFCHLIAYCHKRYKVISFALDGILEVQATGENFVVPEDFSLAEYLRAASGPMLGDPVEIKVRFDAGIARWAKRRKWEFPYTLAEQSDGTVLLCGTVRGLDDIRKELLTWGRHVVVLEPVALRDRIHEEARAIAALYETA